MSEVKLSDDYNLYIGRAASYLIILSLLHYDEEHSGYSLIKKIEKITYDKLKFRAGTIYPQIEKLQEEGLIKRHIRDVPSRSEDIIRQKAVYSITEDGVRVLDQMCLEWDNLQGLIHKIIKGHFGVKNDKKYRNANREV
ncbi:MAG: PadR family transcriptional regulator [Promethearchaeota archaeon]